MPQDRASWNIRDTAILAELVTLMHITAEDQQLLGQLREQASAIAPRLSAAFYERLQKHEHTMEYFRESSMDGLHSTLQGWFVDLFSGVYDEDYAQRHLRIGKRHVEVGVPVRYPLAMMDVIMPFGEEVARQSDQPDAAKAAFYKVLALDIAIFNQAYENNQLQHLTDLVGGERLARLLLSGGG